MTNFSEPVPSLTQSSELTEVSITQKKATSIWLDYSFTGLVWVFATSGAVVLLSMAWIVFEDALPAIKAFGWTFFWTQEWNVGELKFGGLPYIYGTLISSALALFFAVPLGLAVALTTSENFVPAWVRSPVGFMVELIASIPSVIVGLWGIVVLIPKLKPLQEWLFAHFSGIPIFGSEPYGPSMFVAGVLLAIMILPTIAAISRDVLQAVPSDLRSASMALGATRWETIWRTLLPAASSGIIGAVILALGRALGETMAVTMVIGNSTVISPSLLAPGYTIPAVLANQFAEAFEALHIGALMYLALILFVITLIVNSIAVLLVQFINRNR
jgi:phosphate transport system permease protein